MVVLCRHIMLISTFDL